MPTILSKDSATKLLASTIPDAEWLLKQIESGQGWFRFPRLLTNAIHRLKIESYPLLYENEASMASMLLRTFLTELEADKFVLEFEAAGLTRRSELIDDWSNAVEEFLSLIEVPQTEQQEEKARLAFLTFSKEAQEEAILFSQRWFCFFFASFF